jgi:hypothetical protein
MFDDASFFVDKHEIQRQVEKAVGDKAIEKLKKTLTPEEMEALGFYI